MMPSANVTIIRAWTEGGTNGRNRKGAVVSINSDGAAVGSIAAPITAASVGLTQLESCTGFYEHDDEVWYPGVVDVTGNCILLFDLTNATDATRSTPVAVAATALVGEVHGY
jgi:hypothetical protein